MSYDAEDRFVPDVDDLDPTARTEHNRIAWMQC